MLRTMYVLSEYCTPSSVESTKSSWKTDRNNISFLYMYNLYRNSVNKHNKEHRLVFGSS